MLLNNEKEINSSLKENDKYYSLIVNYLPQSIKENDLAEIFSKIGPLKYCKLIQDKQTGYSYGFAFIQYYKCEQHGKLACQLLNGLQIYNKKIQVTQARPQSNETRNTKLYIKGFPDTFNQKNFYDLFSPFGKIVQIRILKDKLIAFIIMSTRTEAQTVKDNLHGYEITQNHILHIKFTQIDSKKHPITSSLTYSPLNFYSYPIIIDQYYLPSTINNYIIYIYGLNQTVNENDLFKLFNQYGNVIRINIIINNKTGLSKGYAFVSMDNYDQALIAIQQLNNYQFHGRYLQVRFKNSSNNN